MVPDHINGTFELAGAFFCLLSVLRVIKDKQVHGVSWWHVGFFSGWGFWNLYYYPYLGQWWSFAGGVSLVIVNTAWVILLIWYDTKQRFGRAHR